MGCVACWADEYCAPMSADHVAEAGPSSVDCPVCGHPDMRWLPHSWSLVDVAFCTKCSVCVQRGAIPAPGAVLGRYRRGEYWRSHSRMGRSLEHGLLLWREFAVVSRLFEVEDMLGQPVSSGAAVLEVGCGPGELLSRLRRERSCKVWGLEPSPREAYLARSRYGINVVSADGSFLPYCCTFDLILAFHVLEHVSDPVAVVRELLGFLSFDGHLVLECPNLASPTAGMPLVQFFEPAHIWTFSLSALKRIVYSAGGQVVRHSDSGFIRMLVTKASSDDHQASFEPHDNAQASEHGEAVWKRLDQYATSYRWSWTRAWWAWSRFVVGIRILMLLTGNMLGVVGKR